MRSFLRNSSKEVVGTISSRPLREPETGFSLLLPRMKKILCPLSCTIALFAASCGSKDDKKTPVYPAAGTIMISGQMPVKESLNNSIFGVTVTADSLTKDGVYDICTIFGFDTARGQFSMPKGLENYKLVIRKENEPYTYMIGFRVPKDTTFYDYFLVSAGHSTISMKYVKAYSFQ